MSLPFFGIAFAAMLGMMLVGMPIAVSMALVGIVGGIAAYGAPFMDSIAPVVWGVHNENLLTSIPLFVLLGELLVRGGFTDRMYRSLSDWLNPLPGGLLHTNIGASAMFAAVSGSSVATAATIGTVAIPAFKGRNYDARLVLGTIAAGATLGILIPPSINMIIYGAMTNTSVGRLYAAGVIPGLLLTALFMAVIVIACWWRPSLAGAVAKAAPLGERLRRLVDLLPPLFLFAIVMGSIYFGWATPTESAALGVVMALLLCAVYRSLSLEMVHECFVTTVSVTAMIMLITSAAFFLNFVLGLMGVPQALASFASKYAQSQLVMIMVLTIFYLILGCFLDALAMVIGTIPIVFPIISALGIDPVWFGIYLVVMAELALITPPVGMNLYVVQGIRKEGLITDVIVGTLPFLFMMLVLVALVWVFPGIALWLPKVSFG